MTGMAARIEVSERDPLGALQAVFRTLLEKGVVEALLVPMRLPDGIAVMPTLISDPAKLSDADPLAPAFPINAARVVSRLTRSPLSATVGVVLRPCEIRAFVELVKLKQGSVENLLVVGMDCLGAYRSKDYREFAADAGRESTLRFCRESMNGAGADTGGGSAAAASGFDLSPACLSCEHPVPRGSDLTVGLLGADMDRELFLIASTPAGEKTLEALSLPAAETGAQREEVIRKIQSERSAHRETMLRETEQAVSSLEGLTRYLGNCVNCYNCRVACPVCYCRECVFVTDVFDHQSSQYLRWAKRKGAVKMPSDTVFYHLTRMAHMSLACVGCGQCSNACPNDIPLSELFHAVARRTQAAFNYEPGRSLDEPPPLSQFREGEFTEVTGGHE